MLWQVLSFRGPVRSGRFCQVDVRYENGILEMILPNVEAAKPKKSTVNAKETTATIMNSTVCTL